MTPPLLLVPVGSQRWRLEQSWTAHDVTVPAGFTTDLASIPWWCGWLLKRNDIPWIVAGVLHDFGFSTQTEPRAVVDARLRDVAITEGAPIWHAWIVWAAVRLFGWRAWKRSRRALAR